MSEKKNIDASILQNLVPLNALTPEHQAEIASQTVLRVAMANKKIFKTGQSDNYRVYIVQGLIALEYENDPPRLIKGGTKEAMYPLDYNRPHKATAITKTNAAFVVLKDDVVERYLAMDQSVGFEVSEVDEDQSDDDWMMKILTNKTFSRIPPANIQTMFIRLEAIAASKGEDVITQGEDGEHFYIISKGKCEVLKQKKGSDEQEKVAELGVGDSFGEEALLASTKRNATVRMLTDGNLMRLKRNDFEELLKEPILDLQSVDFDEAIALTKENHVLLDVRLQDEHKNHCIEGSMNVPLNVLRQFLPKLKPDMSYIVYCDTGARSSAAAFLLNEYGLDAKILQGGLRSQNAA